MRRKRRRRHYYPRRRSESEEYFRQWMIWDIVGDFIEMLIMILFFWKDGD